MYFVDSTRAYIYCFNLASEHGTGVVLSAFWTHMESHERCAPRGVTGAADADDDNNGENNDAAPVEYRCCCGDRKCSDAMRPSACVNDGHADDGDDDDDDDDDDDECAADLGRGAADRKRPEKDETSGESADAAAGGSARGCARRRPLTARRY